MAYPNAAGVDKTLRERDIPSNTTDQQAQPAVPEDPDSAYVLANLNELKHHTKKAGLLVVHVAFLSAKFRDVLETDQVYQDLFAEDFGPGGGHERTGDLIAELAAKLKPRHFLSRFQTVEGDSKKEKGLEHEDNENKEQGGEHDNV